MNIKEEIMNKNFADSKLKLQNLGIILRASKIDGEEVEEDGQKILNRLNVEIVDERIVAIGNVG